MKKKQTVPIEAKAEPVHEIEVEREPEPVLNRGPVGWVKVRANVNIGEMGRDGLMQHAAPGQELEVTPDRLPALGNQVTPL